MRFVCVSERFRHKNRIENNETNNLLSGHFMKRAAHTEKKWFHQSSDIIIINANMSLLLIAAEKNAFR